MKWNDAKSNVVLILLLATLLYTSGVLMIPSKSDEQKPRYGGTMVIDQSSEPKHFLQIYRPGGGYHSSFSLYDALVETTIHGDIIPGLAKSWEISEDGLTYTFHLFENVTWHDGVNFTSADVKYTIEAALEQSPGGYLYEPIDKIEIPDDYTVIFKLKYRFATFLNNLGGWTRYTSIIPKHLYEGTEWGENPTIHNPIGTGPFKFLEYKAGDFIKLVANENYHKGPPYLDAIIIKIILNKVLSPPMLASGELKFTYNPSPLTEIPMLEASGNVRIIWSPIGKEDGVFFQMNMQKPPFDDIRVRRAMLYAINRTEINEKGFMGYCKPCIGPFTEDVAWAFNEDAKYPDYNPDMAEQLLDDAGYPKGTDGVRFGFKLVYATIPEPGSEDASEIVKEQLRQIGVNVGLEHLDWSAYRERVWETHNFEGGITCEYFAMGNDPSSMETQYGTNGSENGPGYSNPTVDALLYNGSIGRTKEERGSYYKEIQEIILEDLPSIALIDKEFAYICNKEYHGFFFEEGTMNTQYRYENVWWEGGTEKPHIMPLPGDWDEMVEFVGALRDELSRLDVTIENLNSQLSMTTNVSYGLGIVAIVLVIVAVWYARKSK